MLGTGHSSKWDRQGLSPTALSWFGKRLNKWGNFRWCLSSWREPIVSFSSQLHIQWCHVSRRVFLLQKLAGLGFSCCGCCLIFWGFFPSFVLFSDSVVREGFIRECPFCRNMSQSFMRLALGGVVLQRRSHVQTPYIHVLHSSIHADIKTEASAFLMIFYWDLRSTGVSAILLPSQRSGKYLCRISYLDPHVCFQIVSDILSLCLFFFFFNYSIMEFYHSFPGMFLSFLVGGECCSGALLSYTVCDIHL